MGNYALSITGYLFNKKTGHAWYLATDIQELYAMYESGKFYQREIANWLGMSETVVRRLIKMKNIIEPVLTTLPKIKYEWQTNPSIV